MILAALIFVLIAGGALAWAAEHKRAGLSRLVALGALAVDGLLVIALWMRHGAAAAPLSGEWLEELQLAWIPRFGVTFHLAADGLSLVLVTLTVLLGLLAVGCSWTEIRERTGFFHFNLLWTLAGVVGVFLALDLFLFYFFWEMMLIPMYGLIVIWGHENRVRAGYKFFLFTQASSLLMLVSIVALYWAHGASQGAYTFDLPRLSETPLAPSLAMTVMLGFLAAFAVKLPAVPLHTWLPEAHTEAPTAGSVILAGLLLKTGAYGLLRIVLPLFPEAFERAAPWTAAIGVAGILYGALLAFAQTDLKKLVAYSSVSHMGFVLLGVSAANEWALSGAVVQIVCHGVTTGALFILVGQLYERIGTRDIERMGGLWRQVPRMGAVSLFFSMASLGLPGLGNFAGEFLVLLGAYAVWPAAAAVAAAGLIAAAMYSLRMVRRVFHGPEEQAWTLADLSPREGLVLGVLALSIIWLGIRPQPLLDAVTPVLQNLAAVL